MLLIKNFLKTTILGLFLIFVSLSVSYADVELDLLNEDSENRADFQKEGFLNKMINIFDKKNPKSNVVAYQYKKEDSYLVKLKSGVSTVINLPENEKIIFFSLGEADTVEVKHNKEIPNLLNLKPLSGYTKTNLVVKTDFGTIYNFYLTTELDEEESPNFTVYVTKNESYEEAFREKILLKDLQQNNDYIKKVKSLEQLNTSYQIKGAKEIAPVFVYDDGKWTYFDFGKNFVSDRLPNAYRVVDSLDSVTNTRIEGNLIVATSLSVEGWTLKNGEKYVCVKPKKSLYEVYKDERFKK